MIDPVVIPDELLKALAPVGLKRLIILPPRKKFPPIETGWASPQKQYIPEQIRDHLSRGHNYGVVGGRGLILLDTDHPETEAIAQTLPETFMVQSGGEGHRYHRYYMSDWDKTTKLMLPTDKSAKGEIRCSGAYVVGPGSIHDETGNLYIIYDPRPLTWLSAEQIQETFKDYLRKQSPQEIEQTRTTQSEFENLDILEVCAAYSIKLEKRGGELRGKNPTHGDNPTSLAVNHEKNVWR